MEYGPDAVSQPRFTEVTYRVVPVEADMVVEERATEFCGAVVSADKHALTLEDRFGARRSFPWSEGGFLLEGVPVTLRLPATAGPQTPSRTASGSVAVPNQPARVARASRILVEGIHDAALVERVWGADLRIEGVVVEPLDGLDNLPAAIAEQQLSANRRLGVLADHLIAGTKESRLAAGVRNPHVLVLGHPYVDVWEAVKPAAVGIRAWPVVPRGVDWKTGVCEALGERGGPQAMWRRVLGSVRSYADLEVPLLRAVEELIDFVTASV